MPPPQQTIVGYAVAAVLIVVVLYFRLRRMGRARPLRIGTLWIVPAIFVVVTALNFVQFPPQPGDWPWLVISLFLGSALGWQRGKLMKIWVEPDTGRLMLQGTPWAVIFLVALILIRMLLRGGLEMEARTWAIGPALINDGFVIFALGLFGVMRAEMALRAQRLRKVHADAGGVLESR